MYTTCPQYCSLFMAYCCSGTSPETDWAYGGIGAFVLCGRSHELHWAMAKCRTCTVKTLKGYYSHITYASSKWASDHKSFHCSVLLSTKYAASVNNPSLRAETIRGIPGNVCKSLFVEGIVRMRRVSRCTPPMAGIRPCGPAANVPCVDL